MQQKFSKVLSGHPQTGPKRSLSEPFLSRHKIWRRLYHCPINVFVCLRQLQSTLQTPLLVISMWMHALRELRVAFILSSFFPHISLISLLMSLPVSSKIAEHIFLWDITCQAIPTGLCTVSVYLTQLSSYHCWISLSNLIANDIHYQQSLSSVCAVFPNDKSRVDRQRLLQ